MERKSGSLTSYPYYGNAQNAAAGYSLSIHVDNSTTPSIGVCDQCNSYWDDEGNIGFTHSWQEMVVEAKETPSGFTLSQNAPNPFNPVTTIHYSLDETRPVTLRVHDLAGNVVATLVDGITKRGEHDVQFDGSQMSSGMYIYTLEAAGRKMSQRMILVK